MMNSITILTILAILSGATLSITGFSVMSSVVAQMTGDNATTSGNMTAEEAKGLANVTVTQMDQAESEEEIEEEAGFPDNN